MPLGWGAPCPEAGEAGESNGAEMLLNATALGGLKLPFTDTNMVA